MLFVLFVLSPPLSRQEQLINLIFGGSLPTRQPDSIITGWPDPRYFGLPNLQRIDKITVEMDHGLHSIIYHFIPQVGNNQLMIYHAGHAQDYIVQISFIEEALERGFAVAAFAMPLTPVNGYPVVEVPNLGTWHLSDHGQLAYLTSAAGHPFRYFLEPVIVSLNYFDDLGYSHISMAGLSGGGWTTTLVAALDERIQSSYPVAGSVPLFLVDGITTRWGDWEQVEPAIYTIADYDDLYVMATSGGRYQLQILMRYDPCCYSGLGWRAYYDDVRERSGGRWDLFNDETIAAHTISAAAMDRIFGELEQFSLYRHFGPIVERP